MIGGYIVKIIHDDRFEMDNGRVLKPLPHVRLLIAERWRGPVTETILLHPTNVPMCEGMMIWGTGEYAYLGPREVAVPRLRVSWDGFVCLNDERVEPFGS